MYKLSKLATTVQGVFCCMLITVRLIIPPAHIIIKMHLYSVMAPGDPVQRHCYERKNQLQMLKVMGPALRSLFTNIAYLIGSSTHRVSRVMS